jgi:hypothetical protein
VCRSAEVTVLRVRTVRAFRLGSIVWSVNLHARSVMNVEGKAVKVLGRFGPHP